MKKILIASLALATTLSLGSALVACSDTEQPTQKGTITVSVDNKAQVNGGTFDAAVGTTYSFAATSSSKATVTVKYVYESETTVLNGWSFTPSAAGSYAFTFSAKDATDFKLTVSATQQQQQPTQCNIEFALGDHAASDAEPVLSRVIVSGTNITLPSAPKAASGYKFTGWNDGEKNYDAGAEYKVTKGVTLTATWDLAKYDVTFALGTNPAANAQKPADRNVVGNINLPAAPAAASGYYFVGWSDGVGEPYPANSPYNVTKATAFTAIWDEVNENTEVTVEFALGDHAATSATKPASQTVSIGSNIKLPLAPTAAEGWQFDGWSDGGANTYDANADYPVTAGCTLTAQWKVKPAITNGDFETGDLTGWTVVNGDDASVSVINRTVFWEGDENFFDMNGETVQKYLQDGEYFLVTDETNLVAIKSETFTLKGDGIISFKFGIAKSPVNYVALCDASTNAELIKVTNDYFSDPTRAQVLLRRFMYANDYIGRNVYIKIVDGATQDCGFVGFDSLKVNLTVAQAQEILTADKQWAATYRQDVIDSNASMGGQAKNIVNAIRDYYSDLTVTDVNNVYFVQTISDKASSEGTVNLTQYLAETSGSMKGVTASTIQKSIVKVNDGTTDYNEGFTSFSLSGGKTYTITYRLTEPVSGKTAEKTFVITVASNNSIINGDFETGTLEGWTVTGDGFGIVDQKDTGWNGFTNQQGDWHVNGWNGAGSENGKGTMRSSNFVLGGTGKISFRLGGGNLSGTYISVKTKAGIEVARFINTKQEPYSGGSGKGEQYMWLYTFDLTSVTTLGTELYIEIVDNMGAAEESEGPWRLLFVDDIKTYHTAESFAALGTENTDWFKAENQLDD